VIEKKDSSVVWHYRNTTPELAYIRSNSLEQVLRELVDDTGLEVYHGKKIIEVKLHAVNKGSAADQLYDEYPAKFVLCVPRPFCVFSRVGCDTSTVGSIVRSVGFSSCFVAILL
jgi:trehalose-phosphatase